MASSGLTCILNCASGSCSGPEPRETLSRIFAELSAPARIFLAPSGNQVPKLARRAVNENSQIIVAAGGDGTIAILMTGYLGGATATNVRVGDPSFIGPVLAGVFVWAGLYLREGRLSALIPVRR